MLQTITDHWDEILNSMKDEYDISDVAFNAWLAPLKLHNFENGTLYLIVPEEGFIRYLNKKYGTMLKVTASEISGVPIEQVEFIVETNIKKTKSINLIKENEQVNKQTLINANLNPKYTFETFVVGKSNSLAHAAALAVAESPGETYNPLYIYGGAGLGKTHLMHSIAHFILKNNPDAKIIYVSSETFINEFVDSIRNKNNITPSEFRIKYRGVDVLLIDDIQFLIGKEGTQEEFFHTFNALYENKKQIVIASDKPPKNIDNLEERLRSRFEWGLTVDISMPDYETRMAILRKKDEIEGYNIDNEVIKYIASNIQSNIRELEGALTKIVAKSRLERKAIDLDLAQELLSDYITPTRPATITSEYIIKTVEEHFGLMPGDLASPKKSKEIVIPRQIAMYLCRFLTKDSLIQIGQSLGKRDHSTVIHGVDKISTEIKTNESLYATVEQLKKKISPQI